MSEPHVQGVRGPIPADELGTVLPHEHLWINEMREQRSIGLVHDERLLLEELAYFSDAGGRTIVDTTTASLADGADPDPGGALGSSKPYAPRRPGTTRTSSSIRAVQRLAEQSGLQIVVATGQYRDPYLDDAWIDQNPTEAIAEQYISELLVGIDGTDVRAGIIGEIGSDAWYVSAREERNFRAAALTQAATGVAITTHAARWPVGLAQLDLLEAAGADPGRVIIGHCDSVDLPDYHLALARRGVFVEFDSIRGMNQRVVRRRVEHVTRLLDAGFLDRVLLSHDTCFTTHLHAFGGTGFDYILTGFREELTAAGVTAAEFTQLVVDNPRRALTGS